MSVGLKLNRISKIDRIARRFEEINENLLAAWTLSFASETFLELVDSSETFELTVFGYRSALAYEEEVANNILSLPEIKALNSDEIETAEEYIDASVLTLVRELRVHLTSMPFDWIFRRESNGVPIPDPNHRDLELDRTNAILFFLPEDNLHRFVVQQGVRRRDGGVTFKVVVAIPRMIRGTAMFQDPREAREGFRISSVFLVGRDYTNQLFIYRLPPQYEFEPICACEEWIFGMGFGDELVKES